jgi:hypothetical protein
MVNREWKWTARKEFASQLRAHGEVSGDDIRKKSALPNPLGPPVTPGQAAPIAQKLNNFSKPGKLFNFVQFGPISSKKQPNHEQKITLTPPKLNTTQSLKYLCGKPPISSDFLGFPPI